jgi:hypothetical protein
MGTPSAASALSSSGRWLRASYLASRGKPASSQASQPPLRANTLLNPNSLSFRATRALVYSLGQAQ